MSRSALQRCAGLAFGVSLVAWGASSFNFSLEDASGNTHGAADLAHYKATVLVFVATDCPNSNTYAPVLARLYREFSAQGVQFLNVYSDASETAANVRQHDAEYRVPYPALLDPHQTLARQTGARSTPEAVVLGPDSQVLYRGSVDDRFVDFGKTKYQPTRDDLREALEEVLKGKPVSRPTTRVVGCAIPGLKAFQE